MTEESVVPMDDVQEVSVVVIGELEPPVLGDPRYVEPEPEEGV